MKLHSLMAACVCAATLAACTETIPLQPAAPRPPSPPPSVPHAKATQRFQCQNGLTLQVRFLSTDKAEIQLDNQRAVLTNAVAASGERYVSRKGLFGRNTEWHQKGGEGMLNFVDPYGNAVETSCSASR